MEGVFKSLPNGHQMAQWTQCLLWKQKDHGSNPQHSSSQHRGGRNRLLTANWTARLAGIDKFQIQQQIWPQKTVGRTTEEDPLIFPGLWALICIQVNVHTHNHTHRCMHTYTHANTHIHKQKRKRRRKGERKNNSTQGHSVLYLRPAQRGCKPWWTRDFLRNHSLTEVDIQIGEGMVLNSFPWEKFPKRSFVFLWCY